jgi:DNA-directed RNA polymerase subunit RPC12/RpoP
MDRRTHTMTQTTESTDYPQDNNLPTEPLRCPNCGALFNFYSPSSNATLLYRCDKCSTDFDIILKEGAVNYKKRNKRKQT